MMIGQSGERLNPILIDRYFETYISLTAPLSPITGKRRSTDKSSLLSTVCIKKVLALKYSKHKMKYSSLKDILLPFSVQS